MQKKIVVHMYLKNGKAVTGFDGKELLEDGDVMSIAQHYSNNGADELLIRGWMSWQPVLYSDGWNR